MTRVRILRIIQTATQRAQIMEMKKQLDNYRMMGGQNISEHIIIMCDMVQQLIFVGYKGLWIDEA